MNQEKATAVNAAIKAGLFVKERLGQIRTIDFKGAFNLVTDVDKGSEKIVVDLIAAEFPQDSIISEEDGGARQNSERKWIIDPLDGTTNFAHGFPLFCVSIGLQIGGKSKVGVVYNPISQEMFTAEEGNGAFLNDKPIMVSANKTLEESLLITGFPYGNTTAAKANLKVFTELQVKTYGVRHNGSAAMGLCYLAAGRADGYWELQVAPWDLAAGTLIIEEAGGKVTNLVKGQSNSLDVFAGNVLATNAAIHDELENRLKTILSNTDYSPSAYCK